MLDQLFEFGKQLVESLGYPGITIGIFLETIIPPIPAEAVIGFAGFLIYEGKLLWVPTILSALLGNFIAVSIFWYIGSRFGKPVLTKYGSWFDITETTIDKAEVLFAKYGYFVVFISQFVPQMRTLIALPAGTLHTTYWKFMLANQLGAGIWFTFLLYLAYSLGGKWEQVMGIIKPYENIIIFFVVATCAIYIFYKIFKIIDKKFLTNKSN